MENKNIWKDKIVPGLKWFFKSFIWLFLLMLFLDLLSKNLVIANKETILNSSPQGVILIPNFLAVSYVINTHAAFGVGIGTPLLNRIMYICIATLASAAIIGVYVKHIKTLSKMYKVCMMLILAGAIGNMIDRIFYTPEYLCYVENGVVDWINFYGIWKFNFNWADSCVVVGCIMLIVYLIVLEVKENTAKNREAAAIKAGDSTQVNEAPKVEEKPAEVIEEKQAEVIEEKPVEVVEKKLLDKAPSKKKVNKKTNTKKTIKTSK